MKFKILIFVIFSLMLFHKTFSQVEITLNKSFIEEYKNKITTGINFSIEEANDEKIIRNQYVFTGKNNNKTKVNRNAEVLIMNGMSNDVGLPLTARVFNPQWNDKTLDIASERKGKGVKTGIMGVWQIWPSYHANFKQVQGSQPSEQEGSNYVFALNPVLKLQNLNLYDCLNDAGIIKYEDARTAIEIYSSLKCNIYNTDSAVKLTISSTAYNSIGFELQVIDSPDVKKDGRFIKCNILSLDGELLTDNIRMIFIKGTEAEKLIRHCKIGDTLRVIGFPRVNFEEIDNRLNGMNNQDVLQGNLPYEIIVVTVLE